MKTHKTYEPLDTQQPVPDMWRPIFSDIVNAFANNDFKLESKLKNVSPLSKQMATHIKSTVDSYGDKLVALTRQTWETSICIWVEDCWEVFVDLNTLIQGQSDLVLNAKVTQKNEQYMVNVEIVYVNSLY